MPSGLVMHPGWLLLKGAPLGLALLSFSVLAENVIDVQIADYKYQPAEISIKVGDSVRWTNHEKRTSHSVLFPAEGGLESERMFPDESWLRRFDRSGRYAYRCGPHPEMEGVVLVAE
jgi:plastocyanin